MERLRQEQIIDVLRSTRRVRRRRISEATCYAWRSRYDGIEVSEAAS
jgi:hypothetical protein